MLFLLRSLSEGCLVRRWDLVGDSVDTAPRYEPGHFPYPLPLMQEAICSTIGPLRAVTIYQTSIQVLVQCLNCSQAQQLHESTSTSVNEPMAGNAHGLKLIKSVL